MDNVLNWDCPFADEIVRVLEINGVFQYETDAVCFLL